MDDDMLELTAGNVMLRRRLDAYADARLSPALSSTVRMRARVMAGAHRQAALTSAGAGLTVLVPETPVARRATGRHPAMRAAGVLLAAALGLSLAVGSALAADASGALYPARLGLETLLLPGDPAERAVAELARLDQRLQEAQAARARGDMAGVEAAMQAYAAIVDVSAREAIKTGDPVASAALEAGVARNVRVLRAIMERAPDAALDGLTRAIDHSDAAIEDIHDAADGNGNGRDVPPATHPGGAGTPAKPTADPAAEPTRTPEPTRAATPEPTPRPERTPRSGHTPPGQPPGGPGEPGGGLPGED